MIQNSLTTVSRTCMSSNHQTATVKPGQSRRLVGGARVCIRNDNRKWLHTGLIAR